MSIENQDQGKGFEEFEASKGLGDQIDKLTKAEAMEEKILTVGNIEIEVDTIPPEFRDITLEIAEELEEFCKNPKIHLYFLESGPNSESGICARMLPQFRTSDYRDRIGMNSNYHKKWDIPTTLLHEIGHSLEDELEEVARQEGLDILPATGEEGLDRISDLVTCYIMDPKTFKNYFSLPKVEDTYRVIEVLLKGKDFGKLRANIEKAQKELGDDMKEPPFFYRVFRLIKNSSK